LPLFFILTSEFIFQEIQVGQVGLKLNGIHQFLIYGDDVNPLGDNRRLEKIAEQGDS
jgi:hypothetical protein